MKVLFIFLLLIISNSALSQQKELIEYPKAYFNFEQIYLTQMIQKTNEFSETNHLTIKGSFKLNPKKGIITYQGQPLEVAGIKQSKYTIVAGYEEEKTYTFRVKTEGVKHELLFVFWKDHQMISIVYPDMVHILSVLE